jgi:hypothetical protein
MLLISHVQGGRGHQRLTNDTGKLHKVMVYKHFHCKMNTESIARELPDDLEPV